MDLSYIDTDSIDASKAFDPLPAGWYKSVITASEEKPTKAQTGSYLKLQFQVIEGDHQGRVFFTQLNLNNPNQTAVQIAQQDLAAICQAIGVRPRDSAELHDKPIMVKLTVKPAKDGYEAGNDVKGYEAVGKKTLPAATAGGAASGASTPPWKR